MHQSDKLCVCLWKLGYLRFLEIIRALTGPVEVLFRALTSPVQDLYWSCRSLVWVVKRSCASPVQVFLGRLQV